MKRESSSRRGLAVALTGGLACGKSAVGAFLAEMGVAVLDTDTVGHELLKKGSRVLDGVVAIFGAGILAPNGDADRKKIAERVFADAGALQRLNGVMHPPIMARVGEWVGETTLAGRDAVVMVPLLFEIGAEQGWDAVICVTADEDRVMERLRARGWSDEVSRRRLGAQWPVAEKARRSNLVIENNGTLDDLKRKTAAAWRQLVEKERTEHG